MSDQDSGDSPATPVDPEASADTRSQAKTPKEQVLSYLIPVIPLVILFLLFVGIILFTQYILDLEIPQATRSFIFIIFTFFACAVYLTKVLGENTSIKINGWALNGTLAIIFVVGYFAAERFQDIAGAVGLQSPTIGFPLAEIDLRCNSGGGEIAQTRRIYTFIGGDQNYIDYAKKALRPSEHTDSVEFEDDADAIIPINMVKEGTPEYAFFSDEYRRSNQTDWVAYSVAAYSGRIPIPTRLNVEHITAFFIDPPASRDGAEGVAELAPGPSVANLIPVARVTIVPKEIASPTRHEVTILLNVLGNKTPCWTPATPDGL